MQLKTLVLANAVCLLFFVSCKKEQEEPVDPKTGCTNCLPSNASLFSGILRTGTYTTTSIAGTPTVIIRASAFFGEKPLSVPQVAHAVTVTAVEFNNDTLAYSGHPFYYVKSPVSLATENWTITGANSIPSFQYKYLKEKPSFTSITGIPDTIKKNLGFTFILTNLEHATGATFLISDGNDPSPKVITKALGVGTDTIRFAPSSLTALATSTNAYVSLVVENAQNVKVEGKDFKFAKDVHWTKKLVIK